MEKLNEKDLVIFDIESTGTSVAKDRIVQIVLIKIPAISTREILEELIKQPILNEDQGGMVQELQLYVNPGMPVPPEATEVHGLTDEFLKDFPLFDKVAAKILSFIEGCDMAGHNIMRFDIPLLAEEFLRVGLKLPNDIRFIDTYCNQGKIFPRTLEYCYRHFTGVEIDAERLHDALVDTRMSKTLLLHQIEKHSAELGEGREALHKVATYEKQIVDYAGKLSVNGEGKIAYAFGKNIGKRVSIDRGYADWMSKSPDYTRDTKWWLEYALSHSDEMPASDQKPLPTDPAEEAVYINTGI